MINNLIKIKYSDQEIICYDTKTVFYNGYFLDRKMIFKNGAEILFLNKRFKDYFWFDRKILYNDGNRRIYTEFICKSVKGIWKLKFENDHYNFEIRKRFLVEIKKNNQLKCIIKLDEIESKKNSYRWVFYELNILEYSKFDEVCAFSVAFMRLFVLTLDTEGTRLPSSIGNIS